VGAGFGVLTPEKRLFRQAVTGFVTPFYKQYFDYVHLHENQDAALCKKEKVKGVSEKHLPFARYSL